MGGLIAVIIGYILMAIGVIALDYKICEFLDILWAFWIQIWGGGIALLGAIFTPRD